LYLPRGGFPLEGKKGERGKGRKGERKGKEAQDDPEGWARFRSREYSTLARFLFLIGLALGEGEKKRGRRGKGGKGGGEGPANCADIGCGRSIRRLLLTLLKKQGGGEGGREMIQIGGGKKKKKRGDRLVVASFKSMRMSILFL